MLSQAVLQKSPFVLFTSVLLVSLMGRASIAFTITPSQPNATEFYREESRYTLLENGTVVATGVTRVSPVKALPLGGTKLTNATLKLWEWTSGGKWKFKKAKRDLEGSFEIVTNQACGLRDDCGGASTGISPIIPAYRGVGSLFHLKYHPAGNDPRPGRNKLHWIQVARANYGSVISGIPFVDRSSAAGGAEPYYDYPGYRFAGEDFFMDQPYAAGQQNASRGTYFTAELYLVEEITDPNSRKKEVIIYNGVSWEWQNQVFPFSTVCPNTSNIIAVSSIVTINSNCPPPTPPSPPTPPTPPSFGCVDSSDGWVEIPCSITADPTGKNEFSQVSWGFGIGSDYLS